MSRSCLLRKERIAAKSGRLGVDPFELAARDSRDASGPPPPGGLSYKGNLATFNVEPALAGAIVHHRAFSHSAALLETLDDVCSTAAECPHYEPWEVRTTAKTPSRFFCLLFKLMLMRPTREQVLRILQGSIAGPQDAVAVSEAAGDGGPARALEICGLPQHRVGASAAPRILALLLLRYCADQRTLWSWLRPFIDDTQPIDAASYAESAPGQPRLRLQPAPSSLPGPSGAAGVDAARSLWGHGLPTVGAVARHLLLSPRFQDAMLPRLAVPVQRRVEALLCLHAMTRSVMLRVWDSRGDFGTGAAVRWNRAGEEVKPGGELGEEGGDKKEKDGGLRGGIGAGRAADARVQWTSGVVVRGATTEETCGRRCVLWVEKKGDGDSRVLVDMGYLELDDARTGEHGRGEGTGTHSPTLADLAGGTSSGGDKAGGTEGKKYASGKGGRAGLAGANAYGRLTNDKRVGGKRGRGTQGGLAAAMLEEEVEEVDKVTYDDDYGYEDEDEDEDEDRDESIRVLGGEETQSLTGYSASRGTAECVPAQAPSLPSAVVTAASASGGGVAGTFAALLAMGQSGGTATTGTGSPEDDGVAHTPGPGADASQRASATSATSANVTLAQAHPQEDDAGRGRRRSAQLADRGDAVGGVDGREEQESASQGTHKVGSTTGAASSSEVQTPLAPQSAASMWSF